MPKPELGTKRNCPSCAARFYDLNKEPIQCPKCAETFEPEVLLKPRRQRAPKVEEVKVEETKAEDEEAEDKDAKEAGEEEEEVAEIEEIDLEKADVTAEASAGDGDDTAGAKTSDGGLEEGLSEVSEDNDILDDEEDDGVLLPGLDGDEEDAGLGDVGGGGKTK